METENLMNVFNRPSMRQCRKVIVTIAVNHISVSSNPTTTEDVMETTNEIPVYTLAQFLKYDKSNTRGASTRGCVRDIDIGSLALYPSKVESKS
jgi:cytochrome P450